MPVIITGDFNEPSHLDWIIGTENPLNFQFNNELSQFVVNWPASNKMLNSGLIDAYRELFSNPVENPGYTWTTQNSINEVHDRIDFVYYNNHHQITLNSAFIIGPDDISDIIIT